MANDFKRKAKKIAKKTAKQAPAGDFGGIPHEAIPASPLSPEDTIDLARNGVEVNRGNSNQQPLSPKGEEAAAHTASTLVNSAPPGSLAPVQTSASVRAQQTADQIADATGSPKAPPQPNLESWAQGNMEGLPAKNVKKLVADLVRKNPNYKIPGQGAMSTRPGESFNDFRLRVLPTIRAAMQELAHDPSRYIPIVLHSQTIKLIEAWIDAGMKDDFSINPEAMLRDHSEAPGSAEALFPVKQSPGWEKEAVDMDEGHLPPPPAILLIRHGMTDSNRENYETMDTRQSALAQLGKQVKAGDFNRARAIAHRAATEFGVSDEDINSMIDGSLPSPEEAADMPHSNLLAVASAAHGTDKFPAYADLLKQRFSNMEGIPPDGQRQLSEHLGRLGI